MKTEVPAMHTKKIVHHITLKQGEEAGIIHEEWGAFFAFVVDGIMVGGDSDVEEKRSRLLSWFMREPSDGRGLSLRYIWKPDTETLTIGIIGRATASLREKSLDLAIGIQRNLSYMLRDFATYRFREVTDQQELVALLTPLQPTTVSAISRESRSVGVHEDDLTAVYPFTFNEKTPLDGLIRTMMNHDSPIAIIISLWPVQMGRQVEQWQRKFHMARQVFEAENPQGEASVYVEKQNMRFVRRSTLFRQDERKAKRQEEALGMIDSHLKSLGNGAMWARLDIASGSDVPSALTETLRFDFFGPQSRLAVKNLSGTDFDKTWRDIQLLNYQREHPDHIWLNNLFDLSQAKTIFQLAIPGKDGVPGIKKETGRRIQIPQHIADELAAGEGVLIAQGIAKKGIAPIRLRKDDLMKHLYLIGKTGSGKSTCLRLLAQSLIEGGSGMCILDPHGDVALAIKENIPNSRAKDFIYFDPANPECHETLNALENDGTEEQREQIFQEFMNMLLKTYHAQRYFGPLYERLLRITFLTGMLSGLTLDQLPKLWHDTTFRDHCVDKIKDFSSESQSLIDFWQRELPDLRRNNDYGGGIETYITNPLSRFTSHSIMRRALCGPKSTFNIDDILNNGKILIARLPKGEMGEISAYSIGMYLTFKLRGAIMRRGRFPETERQDFFYIMDEFQSFLSSAGMAYHSDDAAFTSLTSESRKYRVGLVLAHQGIGQLGAEIRNAVWGNIQSRIIFGVSAEDGDYISSQIPGGPGREAYVSCPNHQAYAQLLVNGQQVGPFSINTLLPDEILSERRQEEHSIHPVLAQLR